MVCSICPNIGPSVLVEFLSRLNSSSLTPIPTVIAAYDKLLNDESLTGQAIECSANKHLFANQPEFLNGAVSKRAVTVWDPLFKMMHSELSGLPDAIS
jgi:hypothetical protein